MKSITIGDVHGREIWKDFADIRILLYAEPDAAGYGVFVPEYDKYIFVGDYTDSFTESNDVIIANLLEIIRFKTLYPDHVVLLWGNHDVAYWKNLPWIRMNGYSAGFRSEIHHKLFEIFNMNRDLFQLAFQYKNYIWTHAGIHFSWYHFVFKKAIKGCGIDDMTIGDQLNEMFNYRLPCLFDNDFHRGGTKKIGGPLWCSKYLLEKKQLRYTHQIVGHTATDGIETFRNKKGDASITFCDVLATESKFYELEI
jgi:hypothetical protein